MKNNILIIILLFFIASSTQVLASFSASANPNSNTVNYYGDSWTSTISVTNNNLACDIVCSAPGISQSQIIPAGNSLSIGNVRVVVDKTPPSPQYDQYPIRCWDNNPNWPCGESATTQQISFTTYYKWCGDKIKNGPEVCDGDSVLCSQINNKYYSTSSANCKSNCLSYDNSGCQYCGDGKINGGEQCDSGTSNNQICAPSYGNSCNYCTSSCISNTIKGPYCGDNIKNGPENCQSCYQDSPCPDGQNSCNNNGQCVDLSTDANCGSIGNKCDTSKKIISDSQKTCSSDNTLVVSIQNINFYKCVNKACQLQQTQQNNEDKCNNNLCQDGHCGCNEGYNACLNSRKCEKSSILDNNIDCKCDFQCKSGICESSKCTEGLISNFNSEKITIKPGESTNINFKINNPFDYSINTNLIIKLEDDKSQAIISGEGCKQNQCTNSLTVPAKGNNNLLLTLNSNNISNIPLTATMTYSLSGKPISIKRDIIIKVTECGKENCNTSIPGLNIINTKNIFYFVLLILLLIGIVYIIKYKPYKKLRNTKKETKEEKLETEKILKKHELISQNISTAIAVSGFTVKYGGKNILNNVNFKIDKGKLVAMIGSSGAGKSTIIESLIGRKKPNSGNIKIFNKNIKEAIEHFGFVPQHMEVYLNQTVLQNLESSAVKYGIKVTDSKINEVLNKINLSHRKDVKANNLSGGQKKLLSLGMELIKDPELLILDEPTTGLDPSSRNQIITLLSGLTNHDKKTILLTTHFMDDCEECDEIIILHNKKIVAQDSPQKLEKRLPGSGKVVNIVLDNVTDDLLNKINKIQSIEKVIREGRNLRILTNEPNGVKLSQKIDEIGGSILETKLVNATMKEVFVYYTGEELDE